jgi:hypothetical protein
LNKGHSSFEGPFSLHRSIRQLSPEENYHEYIPFKKIYILQNLHVHVRELLYLATRDVAVGEEQMKNVLEHNLHLLRQKGFRHFSLASSAIGVATVYEYAHECNEQEYPREILRHHGSVSDQDELRHIILELPIDCTTFEVYISVFGQIVGNAEYCVDHQIDPKTGKRIILSIIHEFGACKELSKLFEDLYDTEEELERFFGVSLSDDD